MQELAAYVAKRLPAQAEHSLPSSTDMPQEQSGTAAHGSAEIIDTLAGLLRDVLGVDVPAQKPFMEASASRRHVSSQ